MINCLGNNILEAIAIIFGKKDWLSVVTPQSDMIETTWYMQAESARHR